MMQNANRVDEVEGSAVTVGSLEGRMVNVALDHVGVRHAAYVCVGGVDRRVVQPEVSTAKRTGQKVEQAALHPGLRPTAISEAPNGMFIRLRIGISDRNTRLSMPLAHAG